MVWEGYAPEPLRYKFKQQILEKYNCKLTFDVVYAESSEQYFPLVRKKDVDLVSLTHHHFKDDRFNYIFNKMLIPVDTSKIHHYEGVMSHLRNSPVIRNKEKVFGIPICQGLYALTYNANKFSTIPTSWKVLWEEEYKEQYVIGGSEFLYNICTVALAMGYPRESISKFDKLNNDIFKQQLRLYVKNAARYWIGQDKAKDLRGMKLSVGWGDGLYTLREEGENWQFANPKEGCVSWFDSIALTWSLRDQPFKQQIAYEWIDFLLEPEFQVEYIIRDISQRPVVTTINSYLTKEEINKMKIDDPDFFRENYILLPNFSKRDRNGFSLLWNGAIKGIEIREIK